MSSHQQIAHRWAQNDASLSLKDYAIIAEGRTIYSYGRHFPIARWFEPVARDLLPSVNALAMMKEREFNRAIAEALAQDPRRA